MSPDPGSNRCWGGRRDQPLESVCSRRGRPVRAVLPGADEEHDESRDEHSSQYREAGAGGGLERNCPQRAEYPGELEERFESGE